MASVDPGLWLFGLAGSAQVEAGRAVGLQVVEEAFADRAYEADGSLRSRTLEGRCSTTRPRPRPRRWPSSRGSVTAIDGSRVPVRADSICVHGDLPGAAARARAVRDALEAAGVELRAPGG